MIQEASYVNPTANAADKLRAPYGIRTLSPWIASIAIVWLVQAFSIPFMEAYPLDVLLYVGINIILAVSLNLVNGFTGQFSMGHAGFMSVGGYMAAFLTMYFQTQFGSGVDQPWMSGGLFLIALMAGGSLAAGVGYLVGLPSLRLRGDYLAIVTLGFGEIIRVLILNMDSVGAARGMPGIPMISNFAWIFTFVVITIFAVWRVVNSAYGRALLAVREDEIAAEAMGVNTTQAKVRAFVIGAFFAGIAGGLFAHKLGYLNPQTFDFNRSFEIIIMVVLGGMGSISGSVIAAVFLTVIREALREVQSWTGVDLRMIIYSVTLIVLMLLRPNGLFGTREITMYLPRSLRNKLSLFGGPK